MAKKVSSRAKEKDVESAMNPSALVEDDDDDDDSDYASDSETEINPTGKNTSNKNKMTAEQEKILRGLGRRETKAVSFLRIIMLGALCVTAAALSYFVYSYTRTDEEQEFESASRLYGAKIIESFHTGLARRLGAIHKLSATLTTQARQQEEAGQPGFPFVTLPDWEIHAADTRVQAEAVYLMYAPLVREGPERKAWEAYTMQARFHVMPSFGSEMMQMAAEDQRYNHTKDKNKNGDGDGFDPSDIPSNEDPHALPDGFHPQVFSWVSGPLPYTNNTEDWSMPGWQPSPALPSQAILNADLSSSPQSSGAYRALVNSGMATVAPSEVPSNSFRDVFGIILKFSQYRYQEESYANDPISIFLYPVFDNFDPFQRQVKGQLSANIYWRLFFRNVLPNDATGVMVVLENTFNQTFSYRIDGSEVTYLGQGDFHDESFDHLGQSAHMADYLRQQADPTTRSYTSVGLDDSYSDYTLHVYPTADTQDTFLTSKPTLYTAVVASIFVLTCGVFVLYDFLVERRQALVMDNALKSGTLIQSLFPANVRDRLMEEADTRNRKTPKKQGSFDVGFEGTEIVSDSKPEHSESTSWLSSPKKSPASSQYKGLPIAEKYENSTVLFADLAGFTKWSSTREPTQVFTLLETLYAAFDKLADRRKVYKIETIGDCYVAVTGVPEEQHDHAARMVKFARAILLKMRSLKLSLVELLGKDTENLELRIGLHSGPVTAGVLRGQRSRFQLFGDTVNTAARMESNGEPGRIHVSEAVATELKDHAYGRWLVAREDKVNAKGKGEMQTYYIVGMSAPSSSEMSGDGTDYEGSTTRHAGDVVLADRDFESLREDEDEAMLDIEEKLQHRASLRRVSKDAY